jgi:hypothetical protein
MIVFFLLLFLLKIHYLLIFDMIKNIAIYGGSFDPPHKSHIALIRYL